GRERALATRNCLLKTNAYAPPAWSVALPEATVELATVRRPRFVVVHVTVVDVPLRVMVVPEASFGHASDVISIETGVVVTFRLVGFAAACGGTSRVSAATP